MPELKGCVPGAISAFYTDHMSMSMSTRSVAGEVASRTWKAAMAVWPYGCKEIACPSHLLTLPRGLACTRLLQTRGQQCQR